MAIVPTERTHTLSLRILSHEGVEWCTVAPELAGTSSTTHQILDEVIVALAVTAIDRVRPHLA
jgi:hypothetical protein